MIWEKHLGNERRYWIKSAFEPGAGVRESHRYLVLFHEEGHNTIGVCWLTQYGAVERWQINATKQQRELAEWLPEIRAAIEVDQVINT
jgi:hypothetical protein